MRELSEEARAVLRDFILVFDLDGFFKGSTEITEGEGAQVLEYMTSMFELAGLPIPTTCMSAKGLAKRSKALRIRVQIQFLAEFGDVFMDAELAWSEAADNEYALDAGQCGGHRFFEQDAVTGCTAGGGTRADTC